MNNLSAIVLGFLVFTFLLIVIIYLYNKSNNIIKNSSTGVVIELIQPLVSGSELTVNAIKEEIKTVCEGNIELSEKGKTFIDELVTENRELFIKVYSVFNEERRKEIYQLAFAQSNFLIRYINEPTLGTRLLKKVIVEFLEKGLYDTTHIKISELSIPLSNVDRGIGYYF